MPSLLTVNLLLVLIIGVTCFLDQRLRTDFFDIYRHAAVETRELQDKPVTLDKVTYFLYTKSNPDEYIKINEDNLELLNDKKIVFFIHGWTNNRNVSWYQSLKNAFLTNHPDYAIVQVDWAEPANQFYYVSSINTYDVAKILANLIVDLNKNHRISLSDILLVGHSLGGQITGFVGKNVFKLTGKKLPRVIALDPAGPLFVQRPADKRLNQDDAEVVHVIHSDGGTFGYKDAIGTIDFFPNGGNSQPGCKRIDLLDITSIVDPIPCDHHRAYEYFEEAILNPTEFAAKKCADWNSYKDDACENVEVRMGNLTVHEKGNFYLETNKERPFSKAQTKNGKISTKLLNILSF